MKYASTLGVGTAAGLEATWEELLPILLMERREIDSHMIAAVLSSITRAIENRDIEELEADLLLRHVVSALVETRIAKLTSRLTRRAPHRDFLTRAGWGG